MIFSSAFDFSTRSSTADSHPVKIDSTPPEKSDRPIKIEGRHLSNLSEINAWYVSIVNTYIVGIDILTFLKQSENTALQQVFTVWINVRENKRDTQEYG